MLSFAPSAVRLIIVNAISRQVSASIKNCMKRALPGQRKRMLTASDADGVVITTIRISCSAKAAELPCTKRSRKLKTVKASRGLIREKQMMAG